MDIAAIILPYSQSNAAGTVVNLIENCQEGKDKDIEQPLSPTLFDSSDEDEVYGNSDGYEVVDLSTSPVKLLPHIKNEELRLVNM